jgi:hypothetical protein
LSVVSRTAGCARLTPPKPDQLQGKKQYGFQLDSGKQQYNLAALKLDDMKEWMKDIKEAKKKAVGVKVVSEDKAAPDPTSPRPPGSPHDFPN